MFHLHRNDFNLLRDLIYIHKLQKEDVADKYCAVRCLSVWTVRKS